MRRSRCRVFGEADPDRVVAQVRRVLSLDQSGSAWAEVGGRDPVIGRLQSELPGLRPVLFHSPYEAAAWSILSQRRHRAQATAVRRRLSAEHGRVFTLPERRPRGLPDARRSCFGSSRSPASKRSASTACTRSLEPRSTGLLDPARLLAMAPDEAMADLQQLPGIGPMYAGLILLRSTGATDILTLGEPRIASYVRHFYGLDHAADSRRDLDASPRPGAPSEPGPRCSSASPATATGSPGGLSPAAAGSGPRRSVRR